MEVTELLMDLITLETLSSEFALDLANSLLPQELELSVETESSRLERTVMEELAAMEPLASLSMDKLFAEALLDLVMP